ncbi:MAG TPA: hypothetical protein VGU43_07455 [Thermoplasmata archaeon]|nr:hypothetical protein [Thermoplasmata archaeon]
MPPADGTESAIEKVGEYRRTIIEAFEEVKSDLPRWQSSLEATAAAMKEAERKCRWEAAHLKESAEIATGFADMAQSLEAVGGKVGAKGAAAVAKEFETMSRLTGQLEAQAESIAKSRSSVEALLLEARDSIVRTSQTMLDWLDEVIAVSEKRT